MGVHTRRGWEQGGSASGRPVPVIWSWGEGKEAPSKGQISGARRPACHEGLGGRGRASTQTGGLLAFSEKGLGSSEGKLVLGNESSFW